MLPGTASTTRQIKWQCSREVFHLMFKLQWTSDGSLCGVSLLAVGAGSIHFNAPSPHLHLPVLLQCSPSTLDSHNQSHLMLDETEHQMKWTWRFSSDV